MSNFLGKLLRLIREECNPRATTKPIVETYLEGSRTFRENSSTEVLEKEGSGVEKERKSADREEEERKWFQIEAEGPVWYQIYTIKGKVSNG